MKRRFPQGTLLLALLLATPTVALQAVEGRRGANGPRPVTRIVELLTKLSKQVETEGKKEEDLYERFVCWGTSIINAKEASNAAAETRIEALEAYLEDLNAGRVTLTSEESDLDTEISELSRDIETAEQTRAKEKDEFATAEAEMTTAVAALKKAIAILEAATGGGSMLVSDNIKVDEKAEEGTQLSDSALLTKAVEMGSRFLAKGDALFLQRVLLGEVPTPSFRPPDKAVFKMRYEVRSSGIQSTLKELLSTFQKNLMEARAKEEQAEAEFKTLSAAKSDQLSSAQEARTKLSKEMGARGLSKQATLEEIDSLKEQIGNDENFIAQTKAGVAKKKAEWKERKVVRSDELAAISKAIAILHSDDNRDLFKQSFASQEYSFVEVTATSHALSKASERKAAMLLERLAGSVQDTGLLHLAMETRVAGGNFTAVLGAIDNMITVLNAQQDEDLKVKERCESERAADARNAALLSRSMDEFSEKVTSTLAAIKQIEEENATSTADLQKLEEEMAKAEGLRKEESEEWAKTDADDAAAADVVQQASDVLTNFYKERQESLLQAASHQQPAVEFTADPGQAPPPPPSTWDSPYVGKQDEKDGVLAILELVKEDIQKDRKKAEQQEMEARQQFKAAMKSFKAESQTLAEAITSFTARAGELEEDIGDARSSQANTKDELNAVLEKMKDAEPTCKFFTVNFKVRSSNRMLEMQGLQQARTILSQASGS